MERYNSFKPGKIWLDTNGNRIQAHGGSVIFIDDTYYYFERVHSETICADLTADYTDVTGYYSTHFPHPHPPYVREATAHFTYNQKQYLITSGTTGYYPNPSEVAVADTFHGPFKVIGNPHVKDRSNTSFHSQISSVFKVEGKKNLYIACGDRWLPQYMDLEYDEYAKMFHQLFSDDKADKKSDELCEKYNRFVMNTSVADYVWLPLRFEEPTNEHPDGMVYIDWFDEWRIEDWE